MTYKRAAYRYALVNLNPFAVVNDDGLYAQHNAAGQLDIYDPAAGTGQLTLAWLADRADMLAWKVRYDTEDKPYGSEYDTSEVDGNRDYVDLASGTTLAVDGNGVSLFDRQIVFGSSGAQPCRPCKRKSRRWRHGEAEWNSCCGLDLRSAA